MMRTSLPNVFRRRRCRQQHQPPPPPPRRRRNSLTTSSGSSTTLSVLVLVLLLSFCTTSTSNATPIITTTCTTGSRVSYSEQPKQQQLKYRFFVFGNTKRRQQQQQQQKEQLLLPNSIVQRRITKHALEQLVVSRRKQVQVSLSSLLSKPKSSSSSSLIALRYRGGTIDTTDDDTSTTNDDDDDATAVDNVRITTSATTDDDSTTITTPTLATTDGSVDVSTSPPTTTTTTLSTTGAIVPTSSSSSSKVVKKSFSNLQQRVTVAIGLLSGFLIVIYNFREIGIGTILLILSIGLYSEASSLYPRRTGNDSKTTTTTIINKWYWFVATSIGTTIPQYLALVAHQNQLLPRKQLIPFFRLVSYILLSFGLFEWIFTTNKLAITATVPVTTDDLVAVEQQQQQRSEQRVLKGSVTEIAYTAIAVLVTVIPISFWIGLLRSNNGFVYLLITALLIIVNDTSAYFVGTLAGKYPIVHAISPNKTIEGYIGATVLTILCSIPISKLVVALLYNNGNTDNYRVQFVHSIILAVYVSIVGPTGGFIASFIKRIHGIKDYSTILGTGHGGFVDRLDCHLFVIPFVYFYVLTFT